MNDLLRYFEVQCPYCGESVLLAVDLSGGPQDYVEDCSVCCRPMTCRVWSDGGAAGVTVCRDDE